MYTLRHAGRAVHRAGGGGGVHRGGGGSEGPRMERAQSRAILRAAHAFSEGARDPRLISRGKLSGHFPD